MIASLHADKMLFEMKNAYIVMSDHGIICTQCYREEKQLINTVVQDWIDYLGWYEYLHTELISNEQWALHSVSSVVDGETIHCDHCYSKIKGENTSD